MNAQFSSADAEKIARHIYDQHAFVRIAASDCSTHMNLPPWEYGEDELREVIIEPFCRAHQNATITVTRH